jgi:uracil-DNA glycosylase
MDRSGHLPGCGGINHNLTMGYDSLMPENRDLIHLEETVSTCRLCPRLVAWREQVAREKRRAYRDQEYWGKPVPGFGDLAGRLLIIGLAPGAHGSNRTGRMFTGDASGDFLYPALFRAGFANQPNADHRDDSLRLHDVFITAVCRCAPPDNKPSREEISTCLPFIKQEMELLPKLQGIVALGSIAFAETLNLLGIKQSDASFGHGAFYKWENSLPWVLASYHPSRQNTQTRRLTVEMFDHIWQIAAEKLR